MLVLIDRIKLASAEGKVVKAEDFVQMVNAQKILAEARQSAAVIVENAVNDREAAVRAGTRMGIEQARAEFAASMVEATARMESAFIGLEARLVRTVMDALEGILREIGDHTVMERLVRRTIAGADRKNPLRLRVSAEQFEMVNSLLSKVLADFPEVQYIDVLKDPGGAPGMCVLESEFGIVDASLDTQLAAVRAGLISAFVGKRRAAPVNAT